MIVAAALAPPFLVQAVAIVVAARVIAYLSSRVGLVPIVGFLIAGVIIGPHALGWSRIRRSSTRRPRSASSCCSSRSASSSASRSSWRIKTLIFGGGGLQVTLASLASIGALATFGVDWRAALFTGFLVSLSSTAIVLKLLGDRGETASPLRTSHARAADLSGPRRHRHGPARADARRRRAGRVARDCPGRSARRWGIIVGRARWSRGG